MFYYPGNSENYRLREFCLIKTWAEASCIRQSSQGQHICAMDVFGSTQTEPCTVYNRFVCQAAMCMSSSSEYVK